MAIRRIWWWTAAPLALVVALTAAAAWLLWTEAGLHRAISALEMLGTAEIRVEGARGRLAGPLQAEVIRISHPRATIVIEGLAADYEPSALLYGRIEAEQIRIRHVSVDVHPRDDQPGPPTFMPRWLTAAVEDVLVDAAEIRSPGGTELRLTDIAATVTATRSRIRFEAARADGGNWSVSGGTGRLIAREPLAMDLRADWTLLTDRSLKGQALAQGNLDRLDVSASMREPGTVNAAITLTSLTGALRWSAQGELGRLDLEQWWLPSPAGPLAAKFTAGGDLQDYGLNGVIHGAGLPAVGVGVNAAFGYRDGWVDIASLVMNVPGKAMRIETRGRVRPAAVPELELESNWNDLAWPLTGSPQLRSARGQLTLRGTEPLDYRVEGDFVLAGLPAAEGWAAGIVTPGQYIVRESSFATLRGRVEASGMLGRSDDRPWTLQGDARDLDPAVLRKELQGRLSFAFAASGVGLDDKASFGGAISGLSGTFRGQRAGGDGLLRHHAGRTEFERVALTLGPARLALHGAFGAGRLLEASLVADDLSGLLPELGGRISATLQINGPVLDLQLAGRNLAWQEHRATVLSADARLDLDDREPSWARIRSSGLVVAGQSLTNTRLSFDGLVRRHRVEFRAGAGEDAVELLGSGSWQDGRYELLAERIAAVGPGLPAYQLELPTRLTLSADRAELAPACFISGPRRICTDARWERSGTWSLRAGTQSFPLEALDLKVPGKPRYSGLLYAEARMTGAPGQPWLAEAQAEVRDALLEYRAPSGRPQQVALGRTRLTVSSSATRHLLNLKLEGARDADINAELVSTRVEGAAFTEMPLHGRIVGSTRQLDLLPLLVGDIDNANGRLAMDLQVSGRLAAPLLQGQVRLTEGALDFYQANLRLRDIDATLSLDQSRLGLVATANAGEGSLALDGRIGWQDRRLSGDLTLKGERLLLVNVPEARVLASPDLRFQLDERRVTVTGTVTVPMARIDPAETANAVLVSSDERIVGPEVADQRQSGFEVHSDLRLVLGDRVTLNAYGLSGRITGSVRARSHPREAAVASGELEVLDGRYRAYTRELDVERGRLLFAGGPVADPGVDLRASRKLPGRKVGVLVRGPLRKPELSLYSEPPLPQAQIASLLIVGQTLDSLQGGDRDNLDAGRASLAAQGSALVAGQLGRYIGIDEVGITQDSADSTSLALGKFLSPRLYVSYGISLVDEINTIKLRYTIGDNWVIRAESGRESAADVEYRIER